MKQWTLDELVSFLKSQDLAGPALKFFEHGVRGVDFFQMTRDVLQDDLRLSRFTSHRVLQARFAFLHEQRH